MGKFVKVSFLKSPQYDLDTVTLRTGSWIWWTTAVAHLQPPRSPTSHCCLSPSLLSPWGVRETNWGVELKNIQTAAWVIGTQECPHHAADRGDQAGREECPYQYKVVLGQIIHGHTVRWWLGKCLLRHRPCRPLVLLGTQPLGWLYFNGEKCIVTSSE